MANVVSFAYIAIGLVGSTYGLPQGFGIGPAISVPGLPLPSSTSALPSVSSIATPRVTPIGLPLLSASGTSTSLPVPTFSVAAAPVSLTTLTIPSQSVLQLTIPTTVALTNTAVISSLLALPVNSGLTIPSSLPAIPSNSFASTLPTNPLSIPLPTGLPTIDIPLPTGLPTPVSPSISTEAPSALPPTVTSPPIIAIFQGIGNELLGSLLAVLAGAAATPGPVPSGIPLTTPSLPSPIVPTAMIVTVTPVPAKREAAPEPQLLGGLLTRVFPSFSAPPVALPSPVSVLPSVALPSVSLPYLVSALPSGAAIPFIPLPSLGLPSLPTGLPSLMLPIQLPSSVPTELLPVPAELPTIVISPATSRYNLSISLASATVSPNGTPTASSPDSIVLNTIKEIPIPTNIAPLLALPRLAETASSANLPTDALTKLQTSLALLNLLSLLDPTSFANLAGLTNIAAVQALVGQLDPIDLLVVVDSIRQRGLLYSTALDGLLSDPVEFVETIGDLQPIVENLPAAVSFLVLQQLGLVNLVGALGLGN